MTGDFLKVMLKAKEIRDRQYPNCPWVVNRNGQRVVNMDHSWKALMKRLGLSGFLFHDLRRTGVHNLVRAGVPETVAMKISGHKTRSVFERYNVSSEEDLKNAAKLLDDYIQRQTVTLTVTPDDLNKFSDQNSHSQPFDDVAERVGIRSRVR